MAIQVGDRTIETTWRGLWRYVAGVVVCLIVGFVVFVLGYFVPLLGYVNLGFHELGHAILYPFPVGDTLTAMGGSLLQVAVPIGLGVYFFWRRKDLLAVGLCGAWAAAALQDVSVYIADAPYQRLPLIGGEHDWAFLLGPRAFDALASASTIATVVRGLGILALLAAIGVCIVGPLVGWRPKSSPRGVSFEADDIDAGLDAEITEAGLIPRHSYSVYGRARSAGYGADPEPGSGSEPDRQRPTAPVRPLDHGAPRPQGDIIA